MGGKKQEGHEVLKKRVLEERGPREKDPDVLKGVGNTQDRGQNIEKIPRVRERNCLQALSQRVGEGEGK